MSDKGIEAVSDAAQTEVTTNVGELLDADGLAGQLEMLLDRVPEEAPASEDEEKAKGEQPPDEGESSDPPEDEAKAEEDALSHTEEETAEAEPALDTDEPSEKDKANKGLFKRIDKLTAKRREAEGRVDGLEAEIRTLRTELDAKEELPSLPPVDGNPYSRLKSTQEVDREMDQAEEVLEWCEGGIGQESCRDGHQATACSDCKARHFWSFDLCAPCPAGETFAIVFIIAVVLFTVLVLFQFGGLNWKRPQDG